MGTVRYVHRVDIPLKNGKSPIELVYSVFGQRKYFRTDIKLFPPSWDPENQRVIFLNRKAAKEKFPQLQYDLLPTQKEADEFNSTILELNSKIKEIEKFFIVNKTPFTSQMVLDKLKEEKRGTKGKDSANNSKLLFEFMQKYINDHATTREPGSLSVYKSVKNHLENYCKATGRKVTFDNIDYSFFQSFQNYLIDVENLNNTTTAKQLSTLKTFLNYARQHGIQVTDKFKDFKIKRETLEVIALTSEEFETLYHLDLSHSKRLAETRDIFCLACTTALRFSDLEQLKREHIKTDEIKLTVKKTKELLTIPLNSYSRAILKIYEGMERPLPMFSNQNLNYAVKDLCRYAKIDEPIEIVRFRGVKREAKTYPKYELIGVHTGRKTFCTLSLEKGMSAEQVMSISGHRDYKSFKRYVKVTEQLKKTVMAKAWDAPVLEMPSKLKAV